MYAINLTVVLLSFLVASGCCGKQCSQGQIRAEGSSFLLQTHTHRLQVSVWLMGKDYRCSCAKCHHLPCLLCNITNQTYTVPCLLQHKGVFRNIQHYVFGSVGGNHKMHIFCWQFLPCKILSKVGLALRLALELGCNDGWKELGMGRVGVWVVIRVWELGLGLELGLRRVGIWVGESWGWIWN